MTGQDRPSRPQEPYPSVRLDDAVEANSRKGKAGDKSREKTRPEHRSFDPRADAPTLRPSDEDAAGAKGEGLMGPAGDPAEGRR